MTPERWRLIDRVFTEALDLDPSARRSFLAKQCAGDPDLHAEVEKLLAADSHATGLVDAAVGAEVRSLEAAPPRTGQRVGPYEILAEIGSGGMGKVYLARRDDDVFIKEVAIKVVRQGFENDETVQRFRQERQILARLEHPYIARVIDGGATTDGLPYLVMEYVKGLPIGEFCERRQLDVAHRLELFRRVCSAVGFAHQNLVVHRDLKPSNILVEDSGVPKLLDFGIAKLLGAEQDPANLTQTHRLLTPQYASPEQVTGEPITTASDVYSLGAVLYELLARTGAHRIRSTAPAELVRAVCEEEVTAPSLAAAEIAKTSGREPLRFGPDLDNIVLMALQKDRRMRYSSVEHFSEDLRRYLDHLPVAARAQTFRYRASKFLRRNRAGVAAAALVTASLIGATIVSTYEARRADRRFQDVRRLANTFLFDIHDQIQSLPGSIFARESIVKTSLEYLDRLARESGGDHELQYELASAYQRIGDVQGYPIRPNLGRTQEALASYRKAFATATTLARAGDPKDSWLLARIHQRIGYLYLATGNAAAREHFLAGLTLAEQLYAPDSAAPENSRLLVDLHVHLAELDLPPRNLDPARQSLARALEVAGAWVRRSPGAESRAALGLCHRWLGLVLASAGDLSGALDHARESVRIREALAAEHPTDNRLRRDLMNSYNGLANVLGDPDALNLEDSAGAAEFGAKAVAIAESLAAGDPNNQMAQSDLRIQVQAGCHLLVEAAPRQALDLCRRSHARLDALAAGQDLPDPGWAGVVLNEAEALRKLEQPAPALAALREAIDRQTRLAASDPANAFFQRTLLIIHNRTGAVLLDLGQPEAAMDHYRSAVAIAAALVKALPKDLLPRRDLADSYEALGLAYTVLARSAGATPRAARHWRSASESYAKSLEIWTEWPKSSVSSVFDTGRKKHAAAEAARCGSAARAVGGN